MRIKINEFQVVFCDDIYVGISGVSNSGMIYAHTSRCTYTIHFDSIEEAKVALNETLVKGYFDASGHTIDF